MMVLAPPLVLSLFSISVVQGAPSNGHTYTFDAVYTKCIKESGVQQADAGLDIFRKTTFGLLQSQSAFDTVLQCVDDKKDTLKNSADAIEWFTGHLFDKKLAEEHVAPLVDIYNSESTCAETWGEKITLCLGTMADLLYTSKPAITSMYEESICGITLQTFSSCPHVIGMETDPSCSFDETYWMMQMGNFFSGLCDFRKGLGHTTSSYSATPLHWTTYDWSTTKRSTIDTTPDTESSTFWNYFNSNDTDKIFEELPEDGILKCSDLGPDILLLFPPSEVTDPILKTMPYTDAVEKHKQVFEKFCSTVDKFSSCVMDMLKNPSTPVERNFAFMINHYQVSAAFTYYCSQMSVITPQFGCTLNSLFYERCHGGFQNIIALPYNEFDEQQLCRMYESAAKCQVDKQLNACNENYGTSMSYFYKMLQSQKCLELNAAVNKYNEFDDRDGTYDYEQISDTMPGISVCYGTLINQFQTVMSMVPESEDESDPTKILIAGMRGMCSMREQIMACVKNVHRTSRHPYDSMMFEVMLPENMDVITEYACDHVDEIERHSLCLLMTLHSKIQGDPGCLGQMQQEIEMVQYRVEQIESLQDMRATIPVLCHVDQVHKCRACDNNGAWSLQCRNAIRSLDVLPHCMYEIASPCSEDFGMTMQTLGRMIKESCNSKMIVSGSEMIQHSSFVLLMASYIALLYF